MSTQKAQALAEEALERISLSEIGLKRSNKCTTLDVFYVMVIRACMTNESRIIIKTPYSLIENLKNINMVLDRISHLKTRKKILLLDTLDNKNFYKGTICNIIE